jgi:hypothetical protein
VKPFFIVFLFYFSFPLQAEVLKFDIVGYQRDLYSYSEVCKKMVSEHMILVSVKDPATLDCMGTAVKIKSFCEKHGRKQDFLRGYANTKLQEVTCEYGKKAFLSLGCDKAHKHFCQIPQKGCEELKKVYADSLEIENHAFIEKDVDNVLNCYFAAKVKEQPEIITRPVRPWEEKEVIDRDMFEFSKVQKDFKNSQDL